jgi:hypothetical protein
MHPVSQYTTGPPPFPIHNPNSSGSNSTSYTPYGSSHKTIHIFHFLVLPNKLFLHQDNHMAALTLFKPLPFNSFRLLNNWIWKIWTIHRIIPRIKGKIETITTWDLEEITPNKTISLGETRIKETKIPKGEPITINHDKGRTKTS